MRELASAYRELGHVALCLTEHNYLVRPEIWEKQCEEAALLSAEMNFPIIVGLEFWLPKTEEILVFGREACRSLLELDDIIVIKDFNDWYISQKDPFALILAHPYLWTNAPDLYLLMDGYEVVNTGLAWDDNYVKKMEQWMPSPRRAYKGQDTHSLDDLRHPCNEVEDLIIKDETDLIKYLSVIR